MVTLMSCDPVSQDRRSEQGGTERERLAAELSELQARAEAAADARERTAARIRADFLALGEAARAVLESIDVAHQAAVTALHVAAEAEVRALLAAADADEVGGPTARADAPPRS